jgi:hypothetical protein
MEVPSPGERREQEPLCLQRTLWPRHWIIIIKVALSFCPKMAETLHPPPNRVSNPCGISAILDRDAADSAEKIPRKPKLKNPTWVSSPKLEPAPGGAGCLALDEDSPGLVGSLGWGASRRAPALGPPQLPISSATTALGSLLPLQLLKKNPFHHVCMWPGRRQEGACRDGWSTHPGQGGSSGMGSPFPECISSQRRMRVGSRSWALDSRFL